MCWPSLEQKCTSKSITNLSRAHTHKKKLYGSRKEINTEQQICILQTDSGQQGGCYAHRMWVRKDATLNIFTGSTWILLLYTTPCVLSGMCFEWQCSFQQCSWKLHCPLVVTNCRVFYKPERMSLKGHQCRDSWNQRYPFCRHSDKQTEGEKQSRGVLLC